MRIVVLASLAIFIVLYIYIVYIRVNFKGKKENKEFLKKEINFLIGLEIVQHFQILKTF